MLKKNLEKKYRLTQKEKHQKDIKIAADKVCEIKFNTVHKIALYCLNFLILHCLYIINTKKCSRSFISNSKI